MNFFGVDEPNESSLVASNSTSSVGRPMFNFFDESNNKTSKPHDDQGGLLNSLFGKSKTAKSGEDDDYGFDGSFFKSSYQGESMTEDLPFFMPPPPPPPPLNSKKQEQRSKMANPHKPPMGAHTVKSQDRSSRPENHSPVIRRDAMRSTATAVNSKDIKSESSIEVKVKPELTNSNASCNLPEPAVTQPKSSDHIQSKSVDTKQLIDTQLPSHQQHEFQSPIPNKRQHEKSPDFEVPKRKRDEKSAPLEHTRPWIHPMQKVNEHSPTGQSVDIPNIKQKASKQENAKVRADETHTPEKGVQVSESAAMDIKAKLLDLEAKTHLKPSSHHVNSTCSKIESSANKGSQPASESKAIPSNRNEDIPCSRETVKQTEACTEQVSAEELSTALVTAEYTPLSEQLANLSAAKASGDFVFQVAASVDALFKCSDAVAIKESDSLADSQSEFVSKIGTLNDLLKVQIDQCNASHQAYVDKKLNILSTVLDEIKTNQQELAKFKKLLAALSIDLNSEQ